MFVKKDMSPCLNLGTIPVNVPRRVDLVITRWQHMYWLISKMTERTGPMAASELSHHL